MAAPSEDDFRWLVSEKARPYLDHPSSSPRAATILASSLRKELSAARVHLVLEQLELRPHARTKFTHADKMFFTRTLLEQASDERVACYKAARFPAQGKIADLCCGLGGDLLGLATRAACCGVDRDPIATLLAQANSAANGLPCVKIIVSDASEIPVDEYDAWHIDPDRRADGKRTTQLPQFEPSQQIMEQLVERQPMAAVKLAPATVVSDDWRETAELEWIASRRECRQQVAWLGQLAQRPGTRRATVVQSNGEFCSISGSPDEDSPVSERIGRYVYEPNAAVYAARLAGAVCRQYQLSAISFGAGYLTGDSPSDSFLLSCFEVLEILPFDLRRLRAAIRERRVGQLEIKVRGAKVDPVSLRKSLLKKAEGDEPLTLLVLGELSQVRVAIARRVERTGE